MNALRRFWHYHHPLILCDLAEMAFVALAVSALWVALMGGRS